MLPTLDLHSLIYMDFRNLHFTDSSHAFWVLSWQLPMFVFQNMGLRQEVELLKKENHILREKLSKYADV